MTVVGKPEWSTNRAGEQAAAAINERLAHLRATLDAPVDLSIATAYFNPGGFSLIADELEACGTVQLLIGAEPVVPELRVRVLEGSATPERITAKALRDALALHERHLRQERDLNGFSPKAHRDAKRLVAWLRNSQVTVKRVTNRFLHAKAFIVTNGDKSVLAGSSNFTRAGLSTNLELNLARYESGIVDKVIKWYGDLWGDAEEYDLAALYEAIFEPHPPMLVFLRMLWEQYGEEIEAERDYYGQEVNYLTDFQKAGVYRASQYLDRYNGVLIADEVGLGKTFIAGALLDPAVNKRRQRAIVVCPAALRDSTWADYLHENALSVECISFQELTGDHRLNPELEPSEATTKLRHEPEHYAMVVIDEAHHLRNPSTQQAEAMRRLLAGSPQKDLVLLTATPVNNTLYDVHELLRLFIRSDAALTSEGIPSIKAKFDDAVAEDPDRLDSSYLMDILDPVCVRRTRPFVKRHYRHDTIKHKDGTETPIEFPAVKVDRIDYDLAEAFPVLFDELEHALDGYEYTWGQPPPDGVLAMARYKPSMYHKDESHVRGSELNLGRLHRSSLLKRFESSAHAFANTCRKMAAGHDGLIKLVAEQEKVATGAALTDWFSTDSDDLDEVDDFLDTYRGDLDDAANYDAAALVRDLQADRDLFNHFAHQAEEVTPDEDPKLGCLIDELAAIAATARTEGVGETETRNRRKVLIFSYFADTVNWIKAHLDNVIKTDPRLADYRGRVAATSGKGESQIGVMWGFAPTTAGAPEGYEDKFDIVVTTDVLSEGVNLQQAQHIINYDLPWNPMRLVQRHGRIDRIGCVHDTVHMRCFFPANQIDNLLGLEDRLVRKLKQAVATFGGGKVLPGVPAGDVTYGDTTKAAIDRIRAGDTTFFDEEGPLGVLSGEEYRQMLRNALQDPDEAERIKTLPYGSGSVIVDEGPEGFVFCVRVGDHPRPRFCAVTEDDDGETVVTTALYACLGTAQPPNTTDKAADLVESLTASVPVPGDVLDRAYEAWEKARDHLVEQWNSEGDVRPEVPRAARRAADVLEEHGNRALDQQTTDRLILSFKAPHDNRILRDIRQVLGGSDDPVDQVQGLEVVAKRHGLEPPERPKPLPAINHDDLHVVAWTARTQP